MVGFNFGITEKFSHSDFTHTIWFDRVTNYNAIEQSMQYYKYPKDFEFVSLNNLESYVVLSVICLNLKN